MKLKGNLRDIKSKRDSGNQEIELHLDKVEYITHKKDGKYYQAYEFIDELEVPLVITGDCLSRITGKHLEEGEYAFQVYDKNGDDYELNPDKELTVTMEYDFDTNLQILTSVAYTATVPNEAFDHIKREASKRRKNKKNRKSR